MNAPITLVFLLGLSVVCWSGDNSEISSISSKLGDSILNLSDPLCNGLVLVFYYENHKERHEADEDLAKFLAQQSSLPLSFIHLSSQEDTSPFENSGYRRLATQDCKACTNVVMINRQQSSEKLAIRYQEILDIFYARQVIVIAEMSTDTAGQFLKEMHNEFLILLLWHNQDLVINEILTWKINDQIIRKQILSDTQMNRRDLKLSTASNMLGRKLRVATLHFPPVVFIDNKKYPSPYIYGIEPSLIDTLAYELNFTYNYFEVSPKEMWGQVTGEGNNRTATGLLGALVRREADVALGNLYLDYTRLEIIGFSSHYSIAEECLSVPAPQPFPKWMALYYPFTPEVWIGTILSIIFSILTLRVIARLSWKSHLIDSYYKDLSFCFLTIAGHLFGLQQAPEIKLLTNRLFFMGWLFGALIISTGYRSGLISFMTFPYTPPPIDTLEQLVKSPIKKIIFDPLMKEILIKSNISVQRELGRQFITNDNLTYMFSLMDSGEWAVDCNLDNLRYEIANRYPPTSNGPRVHIMKECVFSMRAALGLQKNSPLKPYFDRGIEHLIEAGIVQYNRNRFAKKADDWNPKASKELVPFTLNSQQGAFYAMAFCVVVSLLMLTGELVHHYCCNNKILSKSVNTMEVRREL